jgi:outer membrane protein OmpA-like peptidoglycan-associated protein
MLKIAFSSIAIMFAILLVAQDEPVQLTKNASDCRGALMLNDTIVGPVYSPQGFGNELEISGYDLGDPYFIEREHNTVWYKFRAPYDAIFTFDLVPILKDDDFDFLLFKYDGPNFCRDIAAGDKIPIRSNISRKNIEVQGMTGLREAAVNDYVPSGPGSSYSRPVKVKRGEIYYLLVDNPFRENKGHTLYLSFEKIDPNKKKEPEKEKEQTIYKVPYRKLKVTVTDEENGDRIASNITIQGLPDSVQSKFSAVSQVQVDVISYRNYTVSAVKKGYLLASEEILPKNDSLYEVNIELEPMDLGDRINMRNIKFVSDETEILDKSQSSLEQLKDFMQINPEIEIEIQGHVNGESKRNKRKYRKLSKARAKEIYKRLKDAGIDGSRMKYEGFGNAKMIYPEPISNRQAEANRRVEVEITSL